MGKKRPTIRRDDQAEVLVKIKLPKMIHRRLKMAAADRGQTLNETIAEELNKTLPTY